MRPSKMAFLSLFLLLGALPGATLLAQTKLEPSSVIQQEMNGDSLFHYSIEVPSGWFVAGLVRQKGVDLIVTTSSGEWEDEFDQPNGEWGAEVFTILAMDSSTWEITVRPWESDTTEGSFELSIFRWEPIATTPETQLNQLLAPWSFPGSPGAAVAVVQGDDVLALQEAGLANLEYNIPISDTSVFHIASVSKQFAAFSMLLLQEEGRISVDDDIRTYLPELPDFGSEITIEHLMTHTSGLRDQWNLLIMAGWRMDDVITTDHILRLVYRQEELNFEPGAEYLYCNTGFTLLAQIVEAVTDTSYADWTKAHIFEPLGMDDTQFRDDHELVIPNRAYSYSENHRGYRKRPLNFATAGATSLMTTTRDFTRWAQNFKDPGLGSPEIIEQLCERGKLSNGATILYAHGLQTGGYRGANTIHHGGVDAGYRSFFLRFPEKDLSIIVFSNLSTFPFSKFSYDVADLFVDWSTPAFTYSEPALPPAPEFPDEGPIDSYVGQYYSPELDTWYELVIEEGTLSGKHQRHTGFTLRKTGDDTYEASGLLGTLVFYRNETGEVNGFRSSNGRVRNLRFEKRSK